VAGQILSVAYTSSISVISIARQTFEGSKKVEDGNATLVNYNFTRHWVIFLQFENQNLISSSAGRCDLILSNFVNPFSFGCLNNVFNSKIVVVLVEVILLVDFDNYVKQGVL